ncbi:Sperm flagellar protein 1 [Geodia barretti]|uniref:Sperm flagellar protein 1 n=1 Tax=Geodia barretti TaxID=519541 RepID=A0AA35TZ17_GEOBA|nr:Sperm flagellar protein 1 [Geodia barretti]
MTLFRVCLRTSKERLSLSSPHCTQKLRGISRTRQRVGEDHHFDAGYPYDPNELTTSEIPTAYGQFNPLPPTNPQHLHRMATINETTTYEPSRINEMHLPQPHLELPHPQPHLPFPRAPPIKLKPQNPAAPPPFQSRLRLPANYPRPAQPHNTSTLPPIHLHTGTVIEGGVGGIRDTGGQAQVAQTLTKLPNIIHGRSKTYAGRTNNRLGPQSTNVPSVALAGGKRDDSAKQQIRLAEKEQKLFETQEYIQLLQMKVTRLEHLVHIKDMKIQELHRQLAAAHSRHPLLHRH